MRPSRGFIAETDQTGQRIDVVLASILPEFPRGSWQKRIRAGEVLVNGQEISSDYKLKAGDPVTIAETVKPAELNLPIIYEDDDVIVFDKPAGILTHSKGALSEEPTVAAYMKRLFYPEDRSNRAGIVHRLDRATSGIIICAKNNSVGQYLQKQFSGRKVKKTYLAVVDGVIEPDELVIQWPIARSIRKPKTFVVNPRGRAAETALRVKKRGEDWTLVELSPKTGRTHQLRVHLAHLGHAILGDDLYGKRPAARMLLHASDLELILPGGKNKHFSSSLPKEFVPYV